MYTKVFSFEFPVCKNYVSLTIIYRLFLQLVKILVLIDNFSIIYSQDLRNCIEMSEAEVGIKKRVRGKEIKLRMREEKRKRDPSGETPTSLAKISGSK